MLRAIKNYWVFTKRGYRLMVFIVTPIVLLLLNGFCIATEIPLMVSMLIGYIYMVPVDIMSDHWFLGGFYGKNNRSLEYLQSSNRFHAIIRDVVLVDIIRRFVLYVGLFLVVLVMGINQAEQMEWYRVTSFLPMFCFTISQLATLIARHFFAWNHVYAVSAFAMVAEGICLVPLLSMTEKYLWLVQGILLLLSIAAGVFVLTYSLKKVRDSYYDK